MNWDRGGPDLMLEVPDRLFLLVQFISTYSSFDSPVKAVA